MGDVDDLQDGTSRTMRVLMLSTSYPRDLTDWRVDTRRVRFDVEHR